MKIESPIGLPRLYMVRDFEGPLSEYIQSLEWQYQEMMHRSQIWLWGKPLAADGQRLADGRDRLFWHLITTSTHERGEGARRLDLWRCAHLPRVWDILERLACEDPRVCFWRERRSDLAVAPVDFSLLVILREYREHFQLKTAMPGYNRPQRNRWFDRAAAALAC
jgi:hypothetical protein